MCGVGEHHSLRIDVMAACGWLCAAVLLVEREGEMCVYGLLIVIKTAPDGRSDIVPRSCTLATGERAHRHPLVPRHIAPHVRARSPLSFGRCGLLAQDVSNRFLDMAFGVGDAGRSERDDITRRRRRFTKAHLAHPRHGALFPAEC